MRHRWTNPRKQEINNSRKKTKTMEWKISKESYDTKHARHDSIKLHWNKWALSETKETDINIWKWINIKHEHKNNGEKYKKSVGQT